MRLRRRGRGRASRHRQPLQGLRDKMVILANCATEPHDPEEIERIHPFTDHILYDWGRGMASSRAT